MTQVLPLPPVTAPNGIAVNPGTHLLYVTSKTGNSLAIIDPLSGALLKTVGVGGAPYGVAVNRVTNKVYVANFADATLSVVHGATGAVLKTISLATGGYGEPSYVAINETTNRIYVSLHGGDGLAVVSGSTDARLTTIKTGAGAFGVTVDPVDNRIYVSCRDGRTIQTVDGATNTLLSSMTVQTGGEPYALGMDAAARRLYVSYAPQAKNPRQVLAYRLQDSGLEWVGSILVGDGGPNGGGGVGVNSATGHVFTTNSQDDTVTVFDGATLLTLATLPVGDDPMPVAVDPSIGWAYIGNRSGNTLLAQPDVY